MRIAINGSLLQKRHVTRGTAVAFNGVTKSCDILGMTLECRSDPLIANRSLVRYLRMFNARVRDQWIAPTKHRVILADEAAADRAADFMDILGKPLERQEHVACRRLIGKAPVAGCARC